MARRTVDTTDLQASEKLRRVDAVMEIIGIALLPLGLTALLLGWLGVASNGYVFLQLPYVVSGGLLGVGLLFASGMIYLASWISRSSASQRRQTEELIATVRQLQHTLAVLPLAGAAEVGAAVSGRNGGAFVATPSGSMFHRPDCAIVAERADVRQVSSETEGMRPCAMCDPLGSDTSDATTRIRTVN